MSFFLKSINPVSPKQRLLKKIKTWWDTTDQDNDALDTLFENTTIDGYTFALLSGHKAYINAKKEGESITIMDCDSPDTRDQLTANFTKKLNELTGGKKRKTRRNKKSKKSRKSKSRNNYKK
jgi:hypothetical protein